MRGGSNQLISAAELARRLDMNVDTIYRNWQKWDLKGIYIGKALRFRERDVETWLSALASAA